ncbi:MAG TPA: type II toxin-antitoxin system VapC family toxin [Armatimonadota bacterium]|nr:type II toxin-antitoxin system VapC family toxin [Armatimonadota bacterium]HOS42986.1 type II toxin-antitoxin system VapC family toxin [Armatimonadota bacterium]
MNGLPPVAVVDASVAIKLFLIEAYMADVQALFLQAGEGLELYAPDLLPVECANILWKQVQRAEYDPAQARRDLADLLLLQSVDWVSTTTLLPGALEIATAYSITAYDACYVALAERLKAPLLTADQQLAGKLASAPFVILTLETLFAAAEQ